MAGEIATDLGDHDIRTDAVVYGATGFNDMTPPSGCSSHPDIDPQRPQFWIATAPLLSANVPADGPPVLRGYRWADGNCYFSVMHTIIPPNGATCLNITSPGLGTGQHMSGYFGASSRHQGGCHVLMADGAIRFVTDSIEAGNQNLPEVTIYSTVSVAGIQSPYGLWGALGTRANSEVIDTEF